MSIDNKTKNSVNDIVKQMGSAAKGLTGLKDTLKANMPGDFNEEMEKFKKSPEAKKQKEAFSSILNNLKTFRDGFPNQ